MLTINRHTACIELTPYLEGKKLESASALLRGVRKALADIKKEKPCLAELDITEISFLKDQKNGIILKVYFETATEAAPDSPAAVPGTPGLL